MFLTGKRHWYTDEDSTLAHTLYSQSTHTETAKLAFKAGYACTQHYFLKAMLSLFAVVNQSCMIYHVCPIVDLIP